jgi:hypothetical protein
MHRGGNMGRADELAYLPYSVDLRSLRFVEVDGEIFREIYPFEIMYQEYPLIVDRVAFEMRYDFKGRAR